VPVTVEPMMSIFFMRLCMHGCYFAARKFSLWSSRNLPDKKNEGSTDGSRCRRHRICELQVLRGGNRMLESVNTVINDNTKKYWSN
jgi:hypothetical protein